MQSLLLNDLFCVHRVIVISVTIFFSNIFLQEMIFIIVTIMVKFEILLMVQAVRHCVALLMFLWLPSTEITLSYWFRQTKIHNIGATLVGVDKFGNKYYEKYEDTQHGQCCLSCILIGFMYHSCCVTSLLSNGSWLWETWNIWDILSQMLVE